MNKNKDNEELGNPVHEDFLHFIWHNRLFKLPLQTTDGQEIEVLQPGLPNTDSGPDFFNAKLKIGQTVWAGNIEVHVKASDWYAHGHHKDEAYNNTILHVVNENDKETECQNGDKIHTVELKYNNHLMQNFSSLIHATNSIACHDKISSISEIDMKMWLNRMVISRFEDKTSVLSDYLKETVNNWEESFYRILARNFGFNTNSLPFELLAKSLPLLILAKHKNNLKQIEALLFGQAGFLSEYIEDPYYLELQQEYNFLSHKYSLTAIDKHLWKFMRLRPVNFPTIRIAQFAQLIYQSNHLISKITEEPSPEKIKNYFNISTSKYWETHYNFNKESKPKVKQLGEVSKNTILINTIAPFLFIYGQRHSREELQEKSVEILENLPPESNSIIEQWKTYGFKIENAYYSQAFIQLKKVYCDVKKCIHCNIGHRIIQIAD